MRWLTTCLLSRRNVPESGRPRTLAQLREEIDRLDTELLSLLNARARCAEEVAAVKTAKTAGSEYSEAVISNPAEAEQSLPVYYRPEREAQILERIKAGNTGPLADEDVARLFREIISCCLALEQTLIVAYLGPPGTYTQAAASKHFGQAVTTRAVSTIDEIFREVDSGNAHFGVVPVENSTEGAINHTLDCLMESSARICGEVELPIHQALMAKRGIDPAEITHIFSHPQSLAQCRHWIASHWPGVVLKPVGSNAEAARLAAERDDAAAIAGEMAALHYDMQILTRNIEDQTGNKTRFLVLGRQRIEPSGNDKTSLVVSVRNEPGALYRILEPFHRLRIDLTRLESRPVKSGDWSYVFFMDFDGHEQDPEIKALLSALAQVAESVRILGSYPRAPI